MEIIQASSGTTSHISLAVPVESLMALSCYSWSVGPDQACWALVLRDESLERSCEFIHQSQVS